MKNITSWEEAINYIETQYLFESTHFSGLKNLDKHSANLFALRYFEGGIQESLSDMIRLYHKETIETAYEMQESAVDMVANSLYLAHRLGVSSDNLFKKIKWFSIITSIESIQKNLGTISRYIRRGDCGERWNEEEIKEVLTASNTIFIDSKNIFIYRFKLDQSMFFDLLPKFTIKPRAG